MAPPRGRAKTMKDANQARGQDCHPEPTWTPGRQPHPPSPQEPGGFPSQSGKQGVSLLGTLLPAHPTACPQASGPALRQAGTQRGWGPRPGPSWGAERSWQLREKEASGRQQEHKTGGQGGGGAGNTSTRVAQGSSGSKLSRKETHMSHVSLAGPTAGAVMVAASGRHPPWSPAR